MVRIEDMPAAEAKSLLGRIGFGHLGCVGRDGRPYVVPMHYAYDGESLYLLTTEGTKTRFIADNPEVCLQVEEVKSERDWQSVMAFGRAEPITEPEAMEHAMQIISGGHASLQPALGQTQIDSWGRASRVALYRISPHTIDGRKTVA